MSCTLLALACSSLVFNLLMLFITALCQIQ